MRINPTIAKRITTAVFGLVLVSASTACSTTDDVEAADTTTAATATAAEVVTADVAPADAAVGEASSIELFDSTAVHDIDIEFDQDDYDEMIATYEESSEKDWIEATITIDGTVIEQVGLRLKGNSSLFGLTSDTAENPEELPWLIRFDKFVDDQTYQEYGDIVIRSNSTETSMNEAVALELLGAAGLATQEAISTRLTVNGGDTELRLAIEHPDEVWTEANFDTSSGPLYKADSTGDYSYRGDDPDDYDEVFDQKAGDDDLEPLIDFLEFINNADDDEFANGLEALLDIDAFATYLAFQDLIGNFDDIDGPGNNSYLYFDDATGQFTVVSWDLNLAFDTSNVNGGGANGGGRGGPPVGVEIPEDFDPSQGLPDGSEPPLGGGGQGGGGGRGAGGGAGGGGGGGQLGGNVLAERFMDNALFAQMYDDATIELTNSLYTSGTATEIIDVWVDTLTAQADDIVDATTIQRDADAIVSSIQNA